MNSLYKYAVISSNPKPGKDVNNLANIIKDAPETIEPTPVSEAVENKAPEAYLDSTLGTMADDPESRELDQLYADIRAMNGEDAIKFFGQPIDESLYSGLVTSPEMRAEFTNRVNQISELIESEAAKPVKSLIKRRLLGMLRLG